MLNDELISRLEDFIRKFYKNLLLKGLFRSLILLVAVYLLLTLFEHLEYSSSLVRTILFYSYLCLGAVVLFVWVVRPAAKLFKIGKRLTYFQAAKIIGDHFPQVQDRLLNLLQLKELAENENSDLLLASIEQRTSQLSFIPFHKAIDRTKLKKAALIAFCIGAILLIGLLIFPSVFKQTTFRYVNHSVYFEKPAPFEFIVQNKSLKALQQEDFNIIVKTQGKALPDQVDIRIEGQSFKMRKDSKNVFSYTIKQLQHSVNISFYAAEVESRPYLVEVKPKPVLVSLDMKIIYPPYTKMESKTISGINQVSAPKGSTIIWTAQTRDTKALLFDCNGSLSKLTPDKKGRIEHSQRLMSNLSITARTINEFTSFSDSLQFQINAIEDTYPQIAVIEQKDSLLAESILFRGQIKDDYGFSKLEFCVQKHKSQTGEIETVDKQNLDVTQNDNVQEFYHHYDVSSLGLQKGEKLEYFFLVWDNDAVNGSKCTKSEVFTLKVLSQEELEQIKETNSENLKLEAESLISEIQDLQRQIEELNRKLVEKKEISWQERKQAENLAEKQKEIEQRLNDIKDKLSENNRLDEKFSPESEEILEKQKQLEELFDKLLNEQMKEMMEQIQKLMDENIDKNKLNEALNKIEQTNEEISKQLDRNLELFKHLEIEQKTQEIIEDLNTLAKEQKELSENTKNQSKEETLQKQKELGKEFDKQREKLNELQKEMNSLDEPQTLKCDSKKEEKIKAKQQNAEENLEHNNKKEAGKEMNEAGEMMQQMAQELQESMEEEAQEQLGEDIEQIRTMLKNLVRLSMQQEDLIAKTKSTKVSDAGYQDIIRRQYSIKEDLKQINDSLFAMSKRQPQVGNMINQELGKINRHLESAIESILRFNQAHYSNYKNSSAGSSQQYAMTSMNNLALMLTESLENMKQQQQQNQNSKGQQKNSCNNPSQGGKKSSKPSMRELQEALNKELERLQKDLEGQKNQGKQKIGEGAALNERLAKAAAQQEMIRKMVQQAAEEAKSSGGKPNKKLQEIQRQMEQTEKEIVNKTISRRTVNRQAEILTRMLEAEKAEKKKGKDPKRESERGKDRLNKASEGRFSEFEKLKERDLELFKQIPPVYSPFYKKKVNDYFYGSGN